MGFWTVRYILFPVVFPEILLMLLVLFASKSILFLARSLGHWVLSRLRGPRSVSWGIVVLFAWRIPFGVVGILLGGNSFLIGGFPPSVSQPFVVFRTSLLLGVTRRWICGRLGF